MIFKSIALFSIITISTSAIAASSVTCKLSTLKNKSISATLPLNAAGNGGIESDGLSIGKYNYNFSISLEKAGTSYQLDAVIYENNYVQDEVGAFLCKFKSETKGLEFCKEANYTDSGKLISNFSCVIH